MTWTSTCSVFNHIFVFTVPPVWEAEVHNRPWTCLTSNIFILHRQQITEEISNWADLHLWKEMFPRQNRKDYSLILQGPTGGEGDKLCWVLRGWCGRDCSIRFCLDKHSLHMFSGLWEGVEGWMRRRGEKDEEGVMEKEGSTTDVCDGGDGCQLKGWERVRKKKRDKETVTDLCHLCFHI